MIQVMKTVNSVILCDNSCIELDTAPSACLISSSADHPMKTKS